MNNYAVIIGNGFVPDEHHVCPLQQAGFLEECATITTAAYRWSNVAEGEGLAKAAAIVRLKERVPALSTEDINSVLAMARAFQMFVKHLYFSNGQECFAVKFIWRGGRSLGKQKSTAHASAVTWWSASGGARSRERGYAICDRCNGRIPVGHGFLCNPTIVFGDRSPDLVCEGCFDRLPYEAWDSASACERTQKASVDDAVRFQCQKCGKALRAASTSRGKRAQCPRCCSLLAIPGQPARLRVTENATQQEYHSPSWSRNVRKGLEELSLRKEELWAAPLPPHLWTLVKNCLGFAVFAVGTVPVAFGVLLVTHTFVVPMTDRVLSTVLACVSVVAGVGGLIAARRYHAAKARRRKERIEQWIHRGDSLGKAPCWFCLHDAAAPHLSFECCMRGEDVTRPLFARLHVHYFRTCRIEVPRCAACFDGGWLKGSYLHTVEQVPVSSSSCSSSVQSGTFFARVMAFPPMEQLASYGWTDFALGLGEVYRDATLLAKRLGGDPVVRATFVRYLHSPVGENWAGVLMTLATPHVFYHNAIGDEMRHIIVDRLVGVASREITGPRRVVTIAIRRLKDTRIWNGFSKDDLLQFALRLETGHPRWDDTFEVSRIVCALRKILARRPEERATD